MKEKLTVLIPCKDEKEHILECAQSACLCADEILVADAGSQDCRLEIVRSQADYGLVQRELTDQADFKNWAITQATCLWLLIVDANERITTTLANTIRQLLDQAPPCDAYNFQRLNYLFGYPMRHSKGKYNWHIQLLRRDSARYHRNVCRKRVSVPSENVDRLSGMLEHLNCESLEYFTKVDHYTSWMATSRYELGQLMSAFGMTVRLPWELFKWFIIRRGFLDGRAGLVVSLLATSCASAKHAKLMDHWVQTNDPSATPDFNERSHSQMSYPHSRAA